MTSISQAALNDKAIEAHMDYFGFGTNTSPLGPDNDYGHGLQPLNEEQVERALATHGKNIVKTANDLTWYRILFSALVHPFNILLTILAVTSMLAEDDVAGSAIMFTMVGISTVLRFWQEWKSASAAQALRSLVSVMVTVIRRYSCPSDRDPTPDDVARMSNLVESDIKMEDLVPGDWVKLSAGDMIPADVIVLESTDLLVSEAGLTGESMPIEKFSQDSQAMVRYNASKDQADIKKSSYEMMASDAIPMRSTAIDVSSAEPMVDVPKPSAYTVFKRSAKRSIFACFGIRRFESDESAGFTASQELDRSPTRCYMGTSVVSGSATVLVDKTGSDTFFGSMAKELAKKPTESAFQMGIRTISWVCFHSHFFLLLSASLFLTIWLNCHMPTHTVYCCLCTGLLRLDGHHDPSRSSHQRLDQQELGRCRHVCSVCRRRPHPRDAAHDRQLEPRPRRILALSRQALHRQEL